MPRKITPKRDIATGEFYHYCPETGQHTGPTACSLCPHLVELDRKSVSYTVDCGFAAEDELLEFEVPKAHGSYLGFEGPEILRHSDSHGWLEPKLDGVRAIVHVTASGVIITSRRRDKFGKFSQFQDNVPHLRDNPFFRRIYAQHGHTILDGEVLMPVREDTLAATMGVVGGLPEHAAAVQARLGKAQLWLFDLVNLGTGLAALPLYRRHMFLQMLFDSYLPGEDVQLVPHVLGSPMPAEAKIEYLQQQLDAGYEGVVAKDHKAGYFDSQAWLKIKQRTTVDAQIVGWEPGAKGGKHACTLGALVVAVLDAATGQLREIANVVPGDDMLRASLFGQLRYLASAEIATLGMIAELEAQLWTKDGRLRHPRILRWRHDRSSPNIVDFADKCRVVA